MSELNKDHPAIGPIHSLLFPYASTLDVVPSETVEVTVLGTTSESATRIENIPRSHRAFSETFAGEETGGHHKVLVSLLGTFDSFFASTGIPEPERPGIDNSEDDPQSPPTKRTCAAVCQRFSRLCGDNVPFMLNLADWMVQDNSLVQIRSKNTAPPHLDALTDDKAFIVRLVNLLGGALLILILGLARRAFRPKPPKIRSTADQVLDAASRRRMPFEEDDMDGRMELRPTQPPAPEPQIVEQPTPQPEPEAEPEPEPEP